MQKSGLRPPSKITKPNISIPDRNGNSSENSRSTSTPNATLVKPATSSTRPAPAQPRKSVRPQPPTNSRPTPARPVATARSRVNGTTSRAPPPTTRATRKTDPSPNVSMRSENSVLSEEPKPKRPKRAAWDTKGRLEDMEKVAEELKSKVTESNTEVKDMKNRLLESDSKILELEQFRSKLEENVITKTKENYNISAQVNELQYEIKTKNIEYEDKIRKINSDFDTERTGLQSNIKSLTFEKDMLSTKVDGLNSDILSKEKEINTLKNSISEQSTQFFAVETQVKSLKGALEAANDTISTRDKTITKLNALLKKAENTIKEMDVKSREEETIRRKLHNTIQELKGNIRVFCRVRPPLDSEVKTNVENPPLSHFKFPDSDFDSKQIEINQSYENALGKTISGKPLPFAFDRVFGPSTDQAQVFEEINQLIQSALDGYPVCIFAYGQTGSGKTFTMEGPNNHDQNLMGMIPRAVNQIFDTATALKEKGWNYSMEGQYVEIYNENIHDLLTNSNDNQKYDIRHDSNGKTTVSNITVANVESPESVHKLLDKARKNRAVAATNSNERSSRSHSVFTLRLTGKNSITGESSEGVLNLIDLAGSERLAQSGSTGDRLKETQAINKSLSSLGDVIGALASQASHIPYRNSKLTYLLQNSLGGNSKTLMFVNISPLTEHCGETICSLRFATKVNNCQIGTAKRVLKN